MNAVLRKCNYKTIEIQRPSVSSVCCNIFEDYCTSYMNPEGISQIRVKKKAYLKNCHLLSFCARQVVQAAASLLPCLSFITSQILFVWLSLVLSGYFLAVGDFLSKRSLHAEILQFFICFLSPYMKSRLQTIMERQVEMSHVTVLTQYRKQIFSYSDLHQQYFPWKCKCSCTYNT